MSNRVIHCENCKRYVGEIRDAKLMKGLVFICPTCIITLKKEKDNYNPFGGSFGDIFGAGKFGKKGKF